MEAGAASTPAPAAVHAAIVKIGLSGAGPPANLVLGAIPMAMLNTKSVGVAAVAVAVLLGGGLAVVRFGDAPQPPVELSRELGGGYALAEGETVRLVRPPFPAERTALVRSFDAEGMFRGIEGWNCAFAWRDSANESALRLLAGGMPQSDREHRVWFAENVLGVEWYELALNERVRIPAGDWILRADAAVEERLDGLAHVLSGATGRPFTFAPKTARRLCIVYDEAPDAAPQDSPTLILTSAGAPLSADASTQATRHTTSFQGWCAAAGLPFIDDKVSSTVSRAMFAILPDAELREGDANLMPRVRRVLENLESQTEGSFRLERREIRAWTPVFGE